MMMKLMTRKTTYREEHKQGVLSGDALCAKRKEKDEEIQEDYVPLATEPQEI